MQSKGQTAAKVIGIVLVLLLLAGIVAVIYRFTNGFNEDFNCSHSNGGIRGSGMRLAGKTVSLIFCKSM